MRIIGEFDISGIKVTVFKMNEKISVKFEDNLLEQTYKFRDGSGIQTLDQVKSFCSESTINNIQQIFMDMSRTRSNALDIFHQVLEDPFDEII